MISFKSKVFIFILASSTFLGCSVKTINEFNNIDKITKIDSVSYAFGLLNGRSFRNYINSVDSSMKDSVVIKGFTDAMGKKIPDSLYSASQVLFEKWITSKKQNRLEKLKKQAEEYLKNNRKKDGVKETRSGLQYKVIRKTNAEKPTVQDTVIVDYEGRFIDGKVFDSSYKRNKSTEFPLLNVIPGWTEGICLMPIGSKYEFTIPYGLAYGDKGAGNVILPYSVLIFDVELKAVKKFKDKNTNNNSSIKKKKIEKK